MTCKLLTALCFLLLLPSLAIGQTPTAPVPATFFGMHDNHGGTGQTPYPAVTFGVYRAWPVDGALWADTETSRGVYNWSVMDSWIAKLNAHGVTDLLYTFDYTPSWCAPAQTLPCTNHQDFVDFVTTIVIRYGGTGAGKIQHWEPWNEVTSSTFWTGTMTQLVQIQNDVSSIVRSHCPSCTVHTPVIGVASVNIDCNNSVGAYSLNNFIAANGTSNFDVVDVHLYPYPTGAFPEVYLNNEVQSAKCAMRNLGIASKPLWNTEFTWGPNTDLSNMTSQVAWLARAHLLLWSYGMVRNYWYSYDVNWGTLWNGSLLATGVAYEQIYNWMLGSTMTKPCSASGAVWTCGLTKADGKQGLAVWNTAGSSSFQPPAGYTQSQDLAGNTTTLGSTVNIGISPILLTGASAGAPSAPTGLTATVQ